MGDSESATGEVGEDQGSGSQRGVKVIDHSLTAATSLAGIGKDPYSTQYLVRCEVIDVKVFRAMYATQKLRGK
jgi:hypothetical protein